ncbi:MAG: universal stress protein, partial [Nitrosomonadaceae bacterium]|nr:universal stress protein [Nitrosomonadaceae bacterium]
MYNLPRRTLMDPLIQKIILATDFSEASRDASYHAVLLAQTYNAELKALHVFNP